MTHDGLEPRSLHAGVPQLLIGPACVDCLVLPHIAHEQHAVLRTQTPQEFVNLPRAGQARFVDDVEMSGPDNRLRVVSQMPLQCARRDAGFFEYLGCP